MSWYLCLFLFLFGSSVCAEPGTLEWEYPALFRGSCFSPPKPTVVKCPKRDVLFLALSDLYPTSAVFITAAYGPPYENFEELATSLVININKYSPSVTLNVLADSSQFHRLKSWIRRLEQMGESLSKIHVIDTTGTYAISWYTQDDFIGLWDAKNQKPVFIPSPSNDNSWAHKRPRLADGIAKSCGTQSVHYSFLNSEREGFLTETQGGNFEVLTPDLIVSMNANPNTSYGRDRVKNQTWALGEKTYTEMTIGLKKYTGARTLKLPQSVTDGNHIDEILHLVPSNAPCGFSVLKASPKKLLELMRDDVRLNTNKNQNEKCKVDHYPKPENVSFTDPAWKEYVLKNQSYFKNRSCIWLKGSFSDLLLNQEFVGEQLRDQQNIDKNFDLVLGELRKSKTCPSIDVIEVPMLVGSPNPVNGLTVNSESGHSLYFYASQSLSISETYIESELRRRGVRPIAVNSRDYNLGQGNIHCATNTVPMCY